MDINKVAKSSAIQPKVDEEADDSELTDEEKSMIGIPSFGFVSVNTWKDKVAMHGAASTIHFFPFFDTQCTRAPSLSPTYQAAAGTFSLLTLT